MINVVQKMLSLAVLLFLAGYVSAQSVGSKNCDPKNCNPADCKLSSLTSSTALANCDPKACKPADCKLAVAVQTSSTAALPCDPKNCKPADCSRVAAVAALNPILFPTMLASAVTMERHEAPAEKGECVKKCTEASTAIAVVHR